jgi:hypothetical protein
MGNASAICRRRDIKPLVAGTGLTEGVTGSAAQQLDSQQSSNRAEQIVLLATLVLILVLLLVIFRSPIIAILPLIVIALVSQVLRCRTPAVRSSPAANRWNHPRSRGPVGPAAATTPRRISPARLSWLVSQNRYELPRR